ncbi:MAG: Rho termination factor N-terminal domain-containing protein [Candidatus Izemoplasma sp.]|nr:Rho termination factor N-terminal domain-containing protein [Candidatus Izemoplasma sp.]
MKKLVFKNRIVNIVVGSIFILLAAVGYFSGWIEEFLPIFIATVILFIALKQFIFSFREISNKNAIIILLIEILLDFGIVAAMIYYGTYLNLLIGAFIYLRGLVYLIINFVTDRDIEFGEYMLHIVFITVGAFFLFTSIDTQTVLILTLTGILAIIGIIYLQDGIRKVLKKQQAQKKTKQKTEKVKEKKESTISQELKETYKSSPQKENKDKKPATPSQTHKTTKPETELPAGKKVKDTTDKKVDSPDKKTVAEETIKVNKGPDKSALFDKTVVELKEMARDRNLSGYSQLKKSELVDLIVKNDK